jgi:hypothetical protein
MEVDYFCRGAGLEMEGPQPVGGDVHCLVRTSESVKVIRRPNQKKAATSVSFVSRELYFTCMKNKITSNIFVTAMASATTVFIAPRSMNETYVVNAVKQSRATKIAI